MSEITRFVADTESQQRLLLDIPSFTLRKKLSNEVKVVFAGLQVFTNFTRCSNQFEVEKGKSFKQNFKKDQEAEKGTQKRGFEFTPKKGPGPSEFRDLDSPRNVLGF
jgi:hypothetical protein